MKNLRLFRLILVLFCCASTSLPAQQELALEIRARDERGEAEYDLATGVITAPHGVVVTYRDVVLTADKVRADRTSGDIFAEGNVTILYEGHLWTGDQVHYNFITRQIQTDRFRTAYRPAFVGGEGLTGDPDTSVYTASNAIITTDDFAEPGHRLRARQLTLVPNEYVEARDVTLFLGEVPVFYFPYYKYRLGQNRNRFSFTPGYRRLYGPYLLSTYNWYWNEQLQGAVHLDYRERRGFGVGPDLDYNLGPFGRGGFQYYYTHDDVPGVDVRGEPISSDRQRFTFSHYAALRTNLTVKGRFHYQSDPTVLRDFFESEYRKNVQPRTFGEVSQLWPNYTLDVLVQPQINNFFERVERLPDVRLTALRQQIGVTPLYYEGESSIGYFQRQFAFDTEPHYAAWRGDSFHQIVLPQNYFGWLNFTPRVGGRFTYYSEAEGPGAVTDEQHRGVFNTGAELSTKASRVWDGARNQLLDVNGLRHIVEPSLNYSFVPSPTRRPPELPQFDYEVPTLRLLPIEFPDYNAIDAIDSQNVLRFTLLNRLQTKRDGENVQNLVNWALYTDWRIDPREDQRTFSDFFSDMDLRPRSWLTLTSQNRYDVNEGVLREANHRVTVQPGNVWSVSIGHRYLRDNDPRFIQFPGQEIPGHNLINTLIYYRINENWGARISHYFETRDGTIEEQYYTLYRDLRSWTGAFTLRHRQNRVGPDDFSVAVTFSLKAFPRFGLGDDRDRPSLLLGGS